MFNTSRQSIAHPQQTQANAHTQSIYKPRPFRPLRSYGSHALSSRDQGELVLDLLLIRNPCCQRWYCSDSAACPRDCCPDTKAEAATHALMAPKSSPRMAAADCAILSSGSIGHHLHPCPAGHQLACQRTSPDRFWHRLQRCGLLHRWPVESGLRVDRLLSGAPDACLLRCRPPRPVFTLSLAGFASAARRCAASPLAVWHTAFGVWCM